MSDVVATPFASVTTLAAPTPPPAGAAKFTVTPATPIPSAADTFTDADCASDAPAFPLCPPPLTSVIPVGGSVTVTLALSLSPVGIDAVTVTTPRFPNVVSAPLVAFTAATVASDDAKFTGTPGTATFAASNAVAVNVAPFGVCNVTVFGAITTRVAVAPTPTYCTTTSCCGGAGSSGACDCTFVSPWYTGTPFCV